MRDGGSTLGARITLALCTVLHALTHAFASMLVPLYLLMKNDLGRSGVKAIALIVTIYGAVYCLFSYPAGVMADRFNRKVLLGVGLLGNALAILAMGWTRQYEALIGLGIVAGIFGTLFHPTANALIPAHFPKNPGDGDWVDGNRKRAGVFRGAAICGLARGVGGRRVGRKGGVAGAVH